MKAICSSKHTEESALSLTELSSESTVLSKQITRSVTPQIPTDSPYPNTLATYMAESCIAVNLLMLAVLLKLIILQETFNTVIVQWC